ncbi:rhomboid family intramembrane serine protease [Brevundimonas sp.]|uniref:rhomboid family intramembrane serine protease n=1 Tax=Brevundimonas sp. TaxID=1871086 RepID=UPI0025B858A7|nr:rhomboid family intramembrane serine protease [Brevundimonas sp.]
MTDAPPRERLFNAPLVSILVVISIPALFIVQRELPDGGVSLAFRPASLLDGQWWPGLLTAMFVHVGWTHAGMNALGALAFGPPVARRMPDAAGAVGFLLFYMACGVVAALGWGLLHMESQNLGAGASGAVFGLTGAAIRLLGRRDGGLRSLTDRRVLTISAVLMGMNVVVGLIGLMPGTASADIAWEAHAFGYLFGLVAIGPWSRMFSGRTGFDSKADPGDPAG